MTIATIEELEAVLKPAAQARGLPNANYVSEAAWQEEGRALLFGQWAGIGFGKDVPEPGDVRPVELLGMPLLLARQSDGTIKVFQNTCRHRGMILVDEPKNIRGVIRCPYHAWCYGLDGALRTTPHVGGPGFNKHIDIRRDELGLHEVPSATWLDVVFVNIDGKAPPFSQQLVELGERWQEFDKPLYHGGDESSFLLDVKCNWKLAVENYCESYHLPWVHPGLNSYSRLEDHYNIEQLDAWAGQGTMVYRQLELEGRRFPDFAGLSSQWDTAAEYVAFFPNVLFGVHRDHTFSIVLEPLAPGKTREHINLYYAAEPVREESFAPLREKNATLWKTVFEEDIFVVEGMQRGRDGVLFDGGRFSPIMDSPTHLFHKWVAGRLKDARAA